MLTSLVSRTISSKKYKQARYEIYEIFPITHIVTKDSNNKRVSEWFGRFFVPSYILQHKGLIEELENMLNPAKCEGSEYVPNLKRTRVHEDVKYIDVIFFYTWG